MLKQALREKLNPANEESLQDNLPYVLLRLGLSCNADCLFCNVPVESHCVPEMNTDKARRFIRDMVNNSCGVRLDISGGEPTLRKDLPQIIRYAVKQKVETIQVQTNGIALANKAYMISLAKAGVNKLFVGLHSCVPAVHDYLVGVKAAFTNCLEGIKNALALGVEVILNPVITSRNYEELPEYITFISETFPQIRFISLSVVQPRGRAWENKYLIPRYSVINTYIRKTLNKGKQYGLTINNPYCGVPLCIGGWYLYLEKCVEYCENCIKIKAGKKSGFSPDKLKSPVCSECDVKNYCNGVWREYVSLYSFSGLRPLKKEGGKIKIKKGD